MTLLENLWPAWVDFRLAFLMSSSVLLLSLISSCCVFTSRSFCLSARALRAYRHTIYTGMRQRLIHRLQLPPSGFVLLFLFNVELSICIQHMFLYWVSYYLSLFLGEIDQMYINASPFPTIQENWWSLMFQCKANAYFSYKNNSRVAVKAIHILGICHTLIMFLQYK